MRISAFCAAVLTCVVIGHTPPAAAQVDQRLAEEYFKEGDRGSARHNRPTPALQCRTRRAPAARANR